MPKGSTARLTCVWVAGLSASVQAVSVRELAADVGPKRVRFTDETPWEMGYRVVVPREEIGLTRDEALTILERKLEAKERILNGQLDTIRANIAAVQQQKGKG